MMEEQSRYRDYRIAGLHVRMKTFGRTLEQAKPYLTDTTGDADIVIQSTPEVLRARNPYLSLDTCEYLSTGGSFYRQLLGFDGMLLHSSAVIADGYAYVFSAPCGTGKSTHTSLWQQAFAEDDIQILNDDKPALRRETDGWYAYGTPWSGKTDQNINARVPLGGVCMLSRGNENTIQRYFGKQAIFALLEQTARPWNSAARLQVLELIGKLLEEVPVWHMHCTPTTDAAVMARHAMSRETKNETKGETI